MAQFIYFVNFMFKNSHMDKYRYMIVTITALKNISYNNNNGMIRKSKTLFTLTPLKNKQMEMRN